MRLRRRDRHQPMMLPAAGTVQLRGPAAVSAGAGCGAQGIPQRAQARLQGTADLARPRALVTVRDAARCRAVGGPQRGERPRRCQWLPLQPQDPLAQGRSGAARSPQQARRTPCAPGQRPLCAAAGGGCMQHPSMAGVRMALRNPGGRTRSGRRARGAPSGGGRHRYRRRSSWLSSMQR